MNRLNINKAVVSIITILIVVFVYTGAQAGYKLTPVDVSRNYAYADGIQSDGSGGYLGAGVDVDNEWNILTGPLGSPSASAEDDPIAMPTDGWTTSGLSSFATAYSSMTDSGGWTNLNNSDSFELFVNNQATQDPGGAYWPEGWGYSVSYMLITYDTSPTGGNSLGDPMQIKLDIDLSGTLYADSGTNDEYFLDVGYALGTGLTDYNPVLSDPANQTNPGFAQFDVYNSWRSFGESYEEPTLSDSLIYSGVVGDQVQVLTAISSFSYSFSGYTWTDATLGATVSVVPEPVSSTLFIIGAATLGFRRFRKNK